MDIKQYIKNNRLKLLVRPNSGDNEVISYDFDKEALRVNISAPAEENKANIEVIRFFSKMLKKKVFIISGKTSKEKILRIE